MCFEFRTTLKTFSLHIPVFVVLICCVRLYGGGVFAGAPEYHTFSQLNIGRYALFKQEVAVATKAVEEMPKITFLTANILYGVYACMEKYVFQDDYNF